MNRTSLATLSALVLVGLVAASNILTARYGLVWGIVTAGTFTAAATLIVRDLLRELAGRAWRVWVFAVIAAGTALSAVMTYSTGTFPGGPTPLRLAAASGAAFLLAELADTYVYEPLRTAGRGRAVFVSSIAGAVVDTVLFLWLAGFPLWPQTGWQVLVKVTLAATAGAALAAARRPQGVPARAQISE